MFNGWSYNGWDNKVMSPVNVCILEQNADETLSVATNKYISDTVTNGSGSVIVTDFNGDGKADIFLAAHNESPTVAKSSTAYLSNAAGKFDKVILTDAVAAHGASLTSINGIPTVVTSTFAGDFDPSYQYIDGKFVETQYPMRYVAPDGTHYPTIASSSRVVGDFNNDGKLDVAFSDMVFGPSYSAGVPVIGIYTLSDFVNDTGSPELLVSPYFNNKPQYANVPGMMGLGLTHEPRLWIDDFNHDGKPDIVGSALMWTQTDQDEYAMLQFLQNTSSNGVMSFVDKTDSLNKDYNVVTAEVDKQLQMLDIDNSGINTYFSGSGAPWSNAKGIAIDSMAANYILLNDGTGRMHIYMHSHFQNIGNQVQAYLNGLGVSTFDGQPKFVEYITPKNRINLLAVAHRRGTDLDTFMFVNIPLQLNPTVDYKEYINITDRNGSLLIRTWAGNDTIVGGCSSICSVDGGLGVNVVVYAGKRANYTIRKTSTGFTVMDTVGKDGTDNLKNIQFLKFSDVTIDLETGSY